MSPQTIALQGTKIFFSDTLTPYNDGLSGCAKNLATLLDKKNVYFVPFRQDDPIKKPTSLVADFTYVPATIDAALKGEQLQPLLLSTQ